MFWNPAGAAFAQAWAALELPHGSLAVIGGTAVFGMFLPDYDVFYLTRASGVRLPGGRPVFPQVPQRTPEEVLASHGLAPAPPRCSTRQAACAWSPGGARLVGIWTDRVVHECD